MDFLINIIGVFFLISTILLFYMIFYQNKKENNYQGKYKFYICYKGKNNIISSDLELIGDNQCIVLKRSQTLFGRNEKADVIINDNLMSGKHFVIRIIEDSCSIIDCNSLNGTFVNGSRISIKSIFPGDSILAGQTLMTFCKR